MDKKNLNENSNITLDDLEQNVVGNNPETINFLDQDGKNITLHDLEEHIGNETQTVDNFHENKDTTDTNTINIETNNNVIDQSDISSTQNNTTINDNSQEDLVLDNINNHINTGSTNTINVNDSIYNSNDTKDTTESFAEEIIPEQKEENEGISLDKINISSEEKSSNTSIDLSGGSVHDIKKEPRIRIGKITVISVLVSIISIAISVVAYFYNDFITHDLSNIEGNRAYTFVESLKNFTQKYNKNENSTTLPQLNLLGKNPESELSNFINGKMNYIQKKEVLNNSVSNLISNITSKYSKLNEIKNDITRYGFFPKDLSNIISESEPISSIQNSLIALEAIKFSSAISVFSYLDTFTTSLVQSLGIDKESIEEKVGNVKSRGESDINIYIKNCYLNPFESDYDCNYIGDFDKYYANLNDDFDTKFFKELIKYTDSRLEQSEIPSFAISFKEFNQTDNEITFDIEINTLKEDEAELTKKGILSPHIFILNSLINSLRQSRFIVGDDISIKSLNVNQNTFIIGSTEINVNRSVNTFTVHIKKENAVEIDDFVYSDY